MKRVFPGLAKECEDHGVGWSPRDLRWGILEEEIAQGRLLSGCFEQIDHCEHFIGILGDRYGTVLDTLPNALIERLPWIRDCVGRSVTELEMLYGVLGPRPRTKTAFFYLRRSRDADDTTAETSEDMRKLRALKGCIRRSGYPVKEYSSASELGTLVKGDLRSVIRNLPEARLDPLTRVANEHEAYAESRRRAYVARPNSFAVLDEHVAGDGPPLVVLGDSGVGKSALLANWLAHHRQKNTSEFVLQHFIGSSWASADWVALVQRLVLEFARRLGTTLEAPARPDLLRSAFANALRMTAVKERVVIVLDALNQLEDRDAAPDLVWLPTTMPANVRLLVSTLPGRALAEVTRRNWPTYRVGPLAVQERRQLIAEYLDQYGKKLEPARREEIARTPQCENPLFLTALLEETRLIGHHQALHQQIGNYLRAENSAQLYARILERWEHDYETDPPGLVQGAMTMLWAARHGLSDSELLALLGTIEEPAPYALWSPLYIAAYRSLLDRSGLFGPGHDHLRKAIELRWLPTVEDRHLAHLRLAKYFSAIGPVSQRALEELPWQLMSAKAWERLRAVLLSPAFLGRLWEHDASIVRRAWHEVEASSDFRLADDYGALLDALPNADADTFLTQVVAALLLREFGHVEQALAWCRTARRVTANHPRTYRDRLTMLEASILQDRGEFETVVSILDAVLASESAGPPGLSAVAFASRGAAHLALGHFELGLRDLKEAEREAAALGDPRLIAKAALERAHAALMLPDRETAEFELRKAEQTSRASGDSLTLATVLDAQGVLFMTDDVEAALRKYEEETELCRECSDQVGLSRALIGKAMALSRVTSDHNAVFQLLDQAEELCQRTGNPIGRSCAIGCRGRFLRERGRLTEALACQKSEEEILRGMNARLQLAACLVEQAVTHSLLGDTLEGQERLDAANQVFAAMGKPIEHSLERVTQAIVGSKPVTPPPERLASAYTSPQEMELAIRRLRASLDESSSEQPAVRWKHQVVLGNLLKLRGCLKEAEAQFTQALEAARRLFGIHGNTIVNLNLLATVWTELGRLDEAQALLSEALELDRECAGIWGDHRVQTLMNLARLMTKQGRLGEAESRYREAISILELTKPNEHESLAVPLSGLGCVLDGMGKKEEAEQVHRRAVEIDTRELGAEHPRVATRFHNLGCLLESVERFAEARDCFVRVLETDRSVHGRTSGAAAEGLLKLAQLSTKTHDYAHAAECISQAVDVLQERGASDMELCFQAFTLAGPVVQRLSAVDAMLLTKRTLDCAQAAFAEDDSDTGKMLRAMKLATDLPATWTESHGASTRMDAVATDQLKEDIIRQLAERRPLDEGEALLRRAVFLVDQSRHPEYSVLIELLHRLALDVYRRRWPQAEASFGPEAIGLDEIRRGVVSERLSHDPNLQFATAVAWFNISERASQAGDWDLAREATVSSLGFLRPLSRTRPTNRAWALRCAAACWMKGDVMVNQGQSEAAEGAFREAGTRYEELIESDSADAIALRGLAVTWDKLGDLMRDAEDFDAAQELFEKALPLFRQAASIHSQFLRDVSLCLAKLAELAGSRNDIAAAGRVLQDHFALATTLANANPEDPEYQRDLAGAHDRTAALAIQTGDMAAARVHAEAGHAILERLVLSEPSNIRWQQDFAGSCFNLGMMFGQAGEFRRAAGMVNKSYQSLSQLGRSGKLDAKGYRLLQHLREMMRESG